MGQRTQMLIIRKITEANGTQRVTKSLYHKQWGHGRQMYIGMMSAMTNYIANFNPDDFKPTTAGFYPEYSGNNCDLTEEEAQMEAEFLKDVDFDKQDTIYDVFEHCDNNDGGLVIELTHKRDKDYNVSLNIRAGFVLGRYAGGECRFKELVSPEVYSTHVAGEYMHVQFMRLFKATCEYLQVEWVERKMEEETKKTA